jgi:MFS family permease
MLVGRIVAGCGTGMNTATAGVWQAETSKMRSRGKLIVIQMASCIFGVVISNFLTLGFSFAEGSVAWRFPLAFQICEYISHRADIACLLQYVVRELT